MEIVEAYQPAWRDWFTVYSSGGLDVNEARAELLAAAVEGNIEDAIEFVNIVDGPDGERDTEDDQPFQDLTARFGAARSSALTSRISFQTSFFTSGNETVDRIESTGYIGDVKTQNHPDRAKPEQWQPYHHRSTGSQCPINRE